MLEVRTRQFRLENNEEPIMQTYLDWIKELPDYIPGTLRSYNGDYRADFATKVI